MNTSSHCCSRLLPLLTVAIRKGKRRSKYASNPAGLFLLPQKVPPSPSSLAGSTSLLSRPPALPTSSTHRNESSLFRYALRVARHYEQSPRLSHTYYQQELSLGSSGSRGSLQATCSGLLPARSLGPHSDPEMRFINAAYEHLHRRVRVLPTPTYDSTFPPEQLSCRKPYDYAGLWRACEALVRQVQMREVTWIYGKDEREQRRPAAGLGGDGQAHIRNWRRGPMVASTHGRRGGIESRLQGEGWPMDRSVSVACGRLQGRVM